MSSQASCITNPVPVSCHRRPADISKWAVGNLHERDAYIRSMTGSGLLLVQSPSSFGLTFHPQVCLVYPGPPSWREILLFSQAVKLGTMKSGWRENLMYSYRIWKVHRLVYETRLNDTYLGWRICNAMPCDARHRQQVNADSKHDSQEAGYTIHTRYYLYKIST